MYAGGGGRKGECMLMGREEERGEDVDDGVIGCHAEVLGRGT